MNIQLQLMHIHMTYNLILPSTDHETNNCESGEKQIDLTGIAWPEIFR